MPRILRITIYTLILTACTPTPTTPTQNTFYALRITPPTLLEFSTDLTTVTREIPFSFPLDCGLFDIFPAPRGTFLAIELSCSFGQTVLFLDVETGSTTKAFPESDSHFLAWTNDGKAVFLKVDSLGHPQIIRMYPDGVRDFIPITELTYDLAPKPNSHDFTFTFSRGLGFGSEIFLARQDGRIVQQLYADTFNYIAYARWSPDGKKIAFIKIPDSQTPFTIGELWLMDVDGSNPHMLSEADAGHGYAANWSPDGRQIAFVMRENADDPNASQSAQALISNIYIVNVETSEIKQVTHFTEGRAETPHWSPDGNSLVFQSVLNGRMVLQVVDVARVRNGPNESSGETRPILAEPACCPGWMRK